MQREPKSKRQYALDMGLHQSTLLSFLMGTRQIDFKRHLMVEQYINLKEQELGIVPPPELIVASEVVEQQPLKKKRRRRKKKKKAPMPDLRSLGEVGVVSQDPPAESIKEPIDDIPDYTLGSSE